ncbi:23935_t:CDS:2 [Cetraspora pellucida]|uniref:23935_t:CDS:1 n=1 Tax=Cetraspora pellucida TaxID=1433469 RepID=A0A9N8ZIZ1_9GLOM|nr:23935_t:CDS:2 [Cetraspora pellucida]
MTYPIPSSDRRRFLKDFLEDVVRTLNNPNFETVRYIFPNASFDQMVELYRQKDLLARDFYVAENDLRICREILSFDNIQHFSKTLKIATDLQVICDSLKRWKSTKKFVMDYTMDFSHALMGHWARHYQLMNPDVDNWDWVIPEAMELPSNDYTDYTEPDPDKLPPLPSIFGGIVPEPPEYKPLVNDPSSIVLPYYTPKRTLQDTNNNLYQLKKSMEQKLKDCINNKEEEIINWYSKRLRVVGFSPKTPDSIQQFPFTFRGFSAILREDDLLSFPYLDQFKIPYDMHC